MRDSSLSACTQAVIAAEIGPPRARLRLLRRGGADGPRRPRAQHPRRPAHRLAGRDLDRRSSPASAGCATTDGHAAASRPRLPERLDRIAFRLGFRGRRLRSRSRQEGSSYSLLDGDPVTIRHFGEEVDLSPDGLTFGPPPPPEPPRRPSPNPPAGPPQRRPSRSANLTCDHLVTYSRPMIDDVFKALADPTRRLLLDELFEEDGQTLSALEQRLPMSGSASPSTSRCWRARAW